VPHRTLHSVPTRRSSDLPKASQRILLVGTTIPIVALALAIAANWEALTNYSYRDFSMSDRLLTQSRVLLDYLRQILVPSLRGSRSEEHTSELQSRENLVC